MNQIAGQIIALSLLAGLVWLLTKYLKCKPTNPGIVNPQNSALKALFAVACSLIALVLFEYFRRTPHAGLLAPDAISGQIGYLIPALISFVLFLLPAGIAAIHSNEPLRSFGISRTNLWQSALIGSVFVILMFYLQNVDPFETIREFEQQQGIRLIYFALIGFEEEILFRGYMQTRLVAWLGKWQGWGLASIIMALGHFPLRMVIDGTTLGTAITHSLTLIPASYFFGYLMLRTGNVVAPAIIHTFTNWISELQ